MNLIYDHLTASILGVAVFFILTLIQVKGGETSRDQLHYYSAKTHLLDTKEMIEHDFENLGAGVARYDPIFLSKTDSTLEFMEKVEVDDLEPKKVTYHRAATGTVTIDGEEVQLYEVRRLVDDVLTGKGPPTLKAFEMELRDANGTTVSDFDQVAALHVHLVLLPPLGGEDDLHEARWSRTFWPANLSNY